jgi:hypothetical protein
VASIGSLAAILTVNGSSFTAGLTKATSELQNFATKAKGVIGSIPMIGATLMGGLSLTGIASKTMEALGNIADRQKDADKYGISLEQMTGFTLLAGGASEHFGHALGHLAAEFGALTAGNTDAKKKFESTIGVMATASLEGKNLADVYRVVSDQISKMSSGEQAFAKKELFGKAGESLGVISKGSAALDIAIGRAREFGLTLDDISGRAAVNAQRAIANLTIASKGLFEQVAVKAAPVLEKAFTDIAQFVKNPNSWNPFSKDFVSPADLDKLVEKNRAMAKVMEESEKVNLAQEKQTSDFAKSVDELNKKMDLEELAFGKSARMTEVLKIDMTALNYEQEKQVDLLRLRAKALDDATAKMQRDKEMYEESTKVIEENLSPLEKFKNEMNDLRPLARAGFLSPEDYIKAAMRNTDKLRSSLGVDQGQGVVSAAEAGSAAAQQTLAQSEARNAFDSFDDLPNLLRLGNELQEKANEYLKEFAEKNQEILAASF